MPNLVYRVQATWDAEAAVWVATSDDVPGLVTEAPTHEALADKLRTMIPELLEANELPDSSAEIIAFELTSHRRERVSSPWARRQWSQEFLRLAGSAPNFPHPEEPPPAEPGPDLD